MPNQPATPTRSLRASDALWALVKRISADDGQTVTEFVIEAIKNEIRRRRPWERVPPH